MADLRKYEPLDALLVAGDMVGGPGQRVILQRLMDSNAVIIQGNGEQRVISLLERTAPEHYYIANQFSLPRWIRDQLSHTQQAYLCSLPEQRVFHLPGADPIRIVHGSPRKVDEHVLPAGVNYPVFLTPPLMLETIIESVAEPVIIFGHTHFAWQANLLGKLALNPGAVCFPEDGYIGAQYAILEWRGKHWTAVLHRAPYDLGQLIRDYQESGLLSVSPLARVMLQSILTGRDFLSDFFGHVRKVASVSGDGKLPYFPDDVWAEAWRTFPWLSLDICGPGPREIKRYDR